MPLVLGLNAKIYRNSGTFAVPVFEEIGNVRDVTLTLETAEADVTTRTNEGWRATVATLRDASVEFEMVWDTVDPNFDSIRIAYLNNGTVEFSVMDGDITVSGSQGLRFLSIISTFTRTEPLEDALKVQVSAKPAFAPPGEAPFWLIVV